MNYKRYNRYWLRDQNGDDEYCGEIPGDLTSQMERYLFQDGRQVVVRAVDISPEMFLDPKEPPPEAGPSLFFHEFMATAENPHHSEAWPVPAGWYSACVVSFRFEHDGWLPADVVLEPNGRLAYHDLAWCVGMSAKGKPLNRQLWAGLRTRPAKGQYDSIGRAGLNVAHTRKAKVQISPHGMGAYRFEMDLRSPGVALAASGRTAFSERKNGPDVGDRFEVNHGLWIQIGGLATEENRPIFGTFRDFRVEMVPAGGASDGA